MKNLTATLIFALVLSSICAQERASKYAVEDEALYEVTSGQRRRIGTLATSDDFFAGFRPIFTIDRSGETITYIGEGEDGYALYVYRVGMASPIQYYGGQDITMHSKPIFSPSGYYLAFAAGNSVYLYEIEGDYLWSAASGDETKGECNYSAIADKERMK